jgi:hypothetical protein
VAEKKARLGADRWGSTDEHIRHVTAPIEELMAEEFPGYDPFPSGVQWQITRLVREILISEALLPEFGRLFEGLSEERLDELASSFAFANCTVRKRLTDVLAAHARRF